jgi:hypothetical protein
VNAPQVLGNEPDGGRSLLKPKKLRMVGVSIRLSLEYGLGKKSFPPQSNEAASVEVLRMQTPDSHCCYLSAAQRKKLTGPACTEALNEAEEDGTRERAEDNAGGVRVELGVRPSGELAWKPADFSRIGGWLGRQGAAMQTQSSMAVLGQKT